MEFQYFHDYNRLARRGIVEPLICPDDGYKLITRLKGEDGLILHCFMCGVDREPGLRMYQQIQEIVEEHFSE